MRLADAEKAYSDELMRQERLKALAASVPYRDALVNMKSNIHKSTLARTNDYYESSSDSGLSNFQIGLSKLNGFTNERLFSDPKFRELTMVYLRQWFIILVSKAKTISHYHSPHRTCAPTSRARSGFISIFSSCCEAVNTSGN
jgi:hypothetical protein